MFDRQNVIDWLKPHANGQKAVAICLLKYPSELKLDTGSYTSGTALMSSDIGGSRKHEQG